jgi:hypothetical protein
MLEALEDRTLLSANPYQQLATDVVSELTNLQTNVDGALKAVQNIPFLDQKALGGLQQAQVFSNNVKTLLTNLQTELNSLPNSNVDSTLEAWFTNNFPGTKTAKVTTNFDQDTIKVELWLHQEPTAGDQVPFDFGLQGLPFQLTASGSVDVKVGFDYELAFGYQNGFVLYNEPLPNDTNQLKFTAQVNLDPSSQLQANLGVLKGIVTDYVPIANVNNVVAANQNNQNDPHRADPTTLGVDFALQDAGQDISTPSLDANIHVSLYLGAGFASVDAGDQNLLPGSWLPKGTTLELPKLQTHFVVNWNFTSADTTTPDPTQSGLDVSFKNVELDLGSTLKSFAQPLITVVQDVLGPMQPIFNLLTTPIPGISDLSHLVDQGDVTLLSIANIVLPKVVGPDVQPILDLIGDLLPVIKDINSIQGGSLPLGDFNLNSSSDLSDLTSSNTVNWQGLADTNPDDLANHLADLTKLLPQGATGIDLVQSLGGTLGGDLQKLIGTDPTQFRFDFPILSDPMNNGISAAFKLFLGQDVDIFDFFGSFDLKPQNQGNGYIFGSPFPYQGLSLNFVNNMHITGGFRLAYDTFGIREFFKDNLQPSKIGDLLDGFYIDDKDTYLSFEGTIGPQLQLNAFPGVSVTLAGNLGTFDDADADDSANSDSFTIDVFDQNSNNDGGKARLAKLFAQPDLFGADGGLNASLSINVKIGFDTPLGFAGVQIPFNIAQATLVNYADGSFLGENQPPVDLGTKDNQGVLHLNVLGVQSYLQGHGQGNSTEAFEVKDIGGTAGDENLVVSALGTSEEFDDVKSIEANGSMAPINQDITIDGKVVDDATLTGGPETNKLTYEGSGTATLNAGPGAAEVSQLTGGSGPVFETGGAGTDTLIGGPCTGQSFNTLTAGSGVEQLYAGPTSNDKLVGGSGTDDFFAGGGADTMTGNAGRNTFHWQEGNGPLAVMGGSGGANTLIVEGTTPGDQFVAGQDPNGDGGVIVNAPGALIHAFHIQALNLDGLAGASKYTVNDLGLTPIQNVGVNLHEAKNTDQAADEVIVNAANPVNAPPPDETVTVYWDAALTAQQGQTATQVNLRTISNPLIGGENANYTITAAIPKPVDTLRVNTFGGNDIANIESTQPDLAVPNPGGHVFVNTGGGDDRITVGDPSDGLDNFFGPLDVDAGPGHNQVTFDESASLIHDVVTLTGSQVIRSTQTAPVTITNPGAPPRTEIGYPFIINYRALNGDFAPNGGSPGVIFNTAHGSTDLYVAETGSAAPTEVNCGGGLLNSHDNIYVGYDGQAQTPFPATLDQSTLDALHSLLIVHGSTAPQVLPASVLEVDDEAAPAGETYSVGVTSPALGLVQRTGASPIEYDYVAMTLNAGNQGAAIYVPGVEKLTTAAINTGQGKSTVTIGEPPGAVPPVGVLDNIAGLVTVNSGSGTAHVSINDQGNKTPQGYLLSAQQFSRFANQVAIDFSNITDLVFNASDNGFGVNTIGVSGTPLGVPVVINTGDGDASLGVSNLDDIQGVLKFQWKSGKKSLTVSDQSAAANDTYHFTGATGSTKLERTNAAPILLSGSLPTATLAVGLLHDNQIYVVSTAPATSFSILGGVGNNRLLIGPSHSLDPIQGAVSVTGNGPTDLVLDDQNAGSGRGYQVTASAFQLIPAPPTPQPPPIQFTGLTHLALDTAPGATVQVLGTSQPTTTAVSLGAGTNLVTVGSAANTLAPIHGPVVVKGQTGNDALVLTDQNGPAGLSYTITASSIASSQAATGSLHFLNIGNVTLDGGLGTENYKVLSVPNSTTMLTINGRGPLPNFLLGPNQDSAWSITAPNAGTLDSTIAWNGIQYLTGGPAGDSFSFQTAGSLAGKVDGGGGTNTLDYAAFAGNVAVNLPLASATAIAQGIANIQNVTGSQGNDLIVGDAHANVLIGGTGRNLIIGGAGADTIKTVAANADDNILIGSTTNYDTNPAALSALFAEWTRNDLGFDDRRGDLLSGVNGAGATPLNIVNQQLILLNNANVHADASPDTLTGGGKGLNGAGTGRNWFFVDSDDVITNLMKGKNPDQVTKVK